MKQKTFSEKEAIGVIQSMVNASQENYKGSAVFFLWWGWLIFSASLINFSLILLEIHDGDFIWPAVITLGIIGSFYLGWKENREAKSTSYIDRVNQYIWISSLVPIAITTGLGIMYGWFYAYPMFIAIFGWGTFISGSLIRFKPFIIGAIAAWAIAFAMLFATDLMLLPMLAAAIMVSYLIPGHLLRRT